LVGDWEPQYLKGWEIYSQSELVQLEYRFPSLRYDPTGNRTQPTSFGGAWSTDCSQPVRTSMWATQIITLQYFCAEIQKMGNKYMTFVFTKVHLLNLFCSSNSMKSRSIILRMGKFFRTETDQIADLTAMVSISIFAWSMMRFKQLISATNAIWNEFSSYQHNIIFCLACFLIENVAVPNKKWYGCAHSSWEISFVISFQ